MICIYTTGERQGSYNTLTTFSPTSRSVLWNRLVHSLLMQEIFRCLCIYIDTYRHKDISIDCITIVGSLPFAKNAQHSSSNYMLYVAGVHLHLHMREISRKMVQRSPFCSSRLHFASERQQGALTDRCIKHDR